MERPIRFEHHRYLGDKRTQIVYDVDALPESEAARIEDLLASERYLCFGPDTLEEARNRGYRLWKGQRDRDDAPRDDAPRDDAPASGAH